MTSPHEPADSPSIRRPPAPGPLATVTPLSGAPVPDPPVGATQGTLALDLGGAPGLPSTPELRVVAAPDPATDEVRAWAARFAQAVVEVLGGDRPLAQLLRWTSARVYQDLERRVRILARTAPAEQRRRTVRAQVRSVHVFQPERHCAEVSVHVRHGQRSRAIAVRLELVQDRWQCTTLLLG